MQNKFSEITNKKGNNLHIGIIPDGGRRWAKLNNKTLIESYGESRKLLYDILIYFYGKDVFEVSVYAASLQNFKRTSNEKLSFLNIINEALNNSFRELANTFELKIRVVGDISILDQEMQSNILKIESETLNYKKGILNILLAYDPINDIVNTVERDGGLEKFQNNLKISNPVDIIIRTGGANLLSNFLPLQSGFARLYFKNQLFNDIKIADVNNILEHYLKLDLKYGE